MNEALIQFKNFNFQYHAQSEATLHDINLSIYPGEKILIVGPSGSGKSTIGHCINGLIPFSYPGESSGSLHIQDVETKNSSIFELSKLVGTVLQDPDGQFIGLTVAEDIAFALENDMIAQTGMKETVASCAKLVHLEDFLDHAPHELSGGQKQRVSMAGIMVDEVKILLFDEPLANLDPATGKEAIDLIDSIQKKTNTTVIIIEHRLEDVLYRQVDRIILMNEGRIAADMRPNELLSTNLLDTHGIREPLYLAALKYANVTISPTINPAYLDQLSLSKSDKASVQAWYEQSEALEVKSTKETLLEVKDLSFTYRDGVRALDQVSFEIKQGEMISIVGKNGAGKSTLSKLICGFEDATSGDILWKGRSILQDNIRSRAKHIAYVMQNPNQMISCPMIYDEVALGLLSYSMTEDERRERIENTLKICGLYPFRNWPISALSFGQKKRVTIASVLVLDPELIILDEPTAGQDFKHYTEIMEFLCELNRQGVSIVMITHDMHLMLEYTNRALVFSNAHLIADKSAAQVLCNSSLIEEASLKETSLFTLANLCHIPEAEDFVEKFIEIDREVRQYG